MSTGRRASGRSAQTRLCPYSARRKDPIACRARTCCHVCRPEHLLSASQALRESGLCAWSALAGINQANLFRYTRAFDIDDSQTGIEVSKANEIGLLLNVRQVIFKIRVRYFAPAQKRLQTARRQGPLRAADVCGVGRCGTTDKRTEDSEDLVCDLHSLASALGAHCFWRAHTFTSAH
jgi:hypothetical protein